ncbi:hypothetical protein COV39_02270 [Candidatus Berkelbacteria bacterium CG11_big_fil_rev_8_21_14_0_20_40_23]|nr:MAG: hypothetical protein COV39_02270 [Candidatus Berkelbacteria bacterium CG11_big_fil_rev_8_21_14_0_20_40_23]PIX30660.1 MAG: hypothetical protein COZ62_01425 [Candidatus Berkelbacteria bacterium CG_4_8_14_3_um_filter_39_27]
MTIQNLKIIIQKKFVLIKNRRAGFSLIEVMVATSLLAVALSSLLTLAVNSQKNTRYLAEKTFATVKASDGLELVRKNRDNNLLDENPSTNWDNNLFQDIPEVLLFEHKSFDRKVVKTATNCGIACVEISSIVLWDEGKHKVELKTQLTDWRIET